MYIGSWFWEIFRIGYPEIGASSSLERDEFRTGTRIVATLVSTDENLVGYLRTRDDYVHLMFTPETFLDDIEMKESEESASETISEGG